MFDWKFYMIFRRPKEGTLWGVWHRKEEKYWKDKNTEENNKTTPITAWEASKGKFSNHLLSPAS
jgi:hypothetical protein